MFCFVRVESVYNCFRVVTVPFFLHPDGGAGRLSRLYQFFLHIVRIACVLFCFWFSFDCVCVPSGVGGDEGRVVWAA